MTTKKAKPKKRQPQQMWGVKMDDDKLRCAESSRSLARSMARYGGGRVVKVEVREVL